MSNRPLAYLAVILAAAPLLAAAQVQAPVPAPDTAAATPSQYVPPLLGAPNNRVSGATRGLSPRANRPDILTRRQERTEPRQPN